MSLGLGRAQSVELDADGTLILEFEPGADSALNFFQTPENHAALEAFLKEETDNVLSVRAYQARQQPPENPPEAAPDIAPATEEASGGEVARLREDAGIATVLNEFKGVIVEVQSPQGEHIKHK